MFPGSRPEWHSKSLCLGIGELFFLNDGEGSVESLRAKAICADCPVRVDCLDFAVRTSQGFGVWGGLVPSEIRTVRRAFLRTESGKDPHAYARAIAESTQYLGRVFAGHEDEREATPRHECERCGEWVEAAVMPADKNGPGAKCGVPATYNRGCRCPPCREAKRVFQQEQRRTAREETANVATPRKKPRAKRKKRSA